jgi:uncharacterized protein (DUF433 family)
MVESFEIIRDITQRSLPTAVGKNWAIEAPAYSLSTASRYLRIKHSILYYWTHGRNVAGPLITLPLRSSSVSFANLLEFHVLKAFLSKYSLRLPRVMSALMAVRSMSGSGHPFLTEEFRAEGINSFWTTANSDRAVDLVGRNELQKVVELYLNRIENKNGIPKLFPFVATERVDEPKLISITPTVAFGRSVIAGTGISTAVVAARFNARESIRCLSREYGLAVEQVEEAIRWETEGEVLD